jgi:U6 snRNA-associated Sm-like protein LSm1
MLVVLRDGRKLHGVLRSYDQFGTFLSFLFCFWTCAPKFLFIYLNDHLANLVLEDTVERIYAGNTFAEKWCGLFLIRGENVVLLGEIVLSPSPRICLLLIPDCLTGFGSRRRCPTTSSGV